jgi:FHS family glucose/mannose:H+ symporter-like MFS transporter
MHRAGAFGAGAVMARFDWYPVLNICLGSLAALIILVLPLADGLPARPIASWRDAPAAAFLFPLIGFALAPIYPTIISVMLSAMPGRSHPPLMGLVVVFSALGGTTGSIITGALFAHLDGCTAFTLMRVPTAVLAGGLFLLRRRIRALDAGSRKRGVTGVASMRREWGVAAENGGAHADASVE